MSLLLLLRGKLFDPPYRPDPPERALRAAAAERAAPASAPARPG
jgi:hypothetical protein